MIMKMSTDAGIISPAFFNPNGIHAFKVHRRDLPDRILEPE